MQEEARLKAEIKILMFLKGNFNILGEQIDIFDQNIEEFLKREKKIRYKNKL